MGAMGPLMGVVIKPLVVRTERNQCVVASSHSGRVGVNGA